MDSNILTTLISMPAIGALLILLLARGEGAQAKFLARTIALLATLATLIGCLILWSRFDPALSTFQFAEQRAWFESGRVSYFLGVDGISIFLIVLTGVLMPVCILCSWQTIQSRVPMFMICFLLLEAMVIGVFCALDAFLFYLFFEAMLIPMYLLIGIWGGKQRVYAAFKFFLYTLAGSVLMLVALLYLYFTFNTSSIPELMLRAPNLPLEIQTWLWLAMFASFAVKVPMWPVHTWLPDAHVQAPTAGSVILAGILLKMGGYGFLRFSLPFFPDASHMLAPMVFVLSVIAVVYTSLVALVQEDIKKLIAYSSVAHMGFVTAGIFSFNLQAVQGATVQMLSHGLVSGALFLCVGVIYDRLHTREIARFGGIVRVMPAFAAVFMVFTMASVGLPGTSGFVGEFLVLAGAFAANTWLALGIATGMVLGAAYALQLYRRTMFGEIHHAEIAQMQDISAREWLCFLPLILGVAWMGVYPNSFLKPMEASVKHLLTQVGGHP